MSTLAFVIVFGLAAVLFAALVVASRQPMRAALALVAHMVSLAAIYATLDVHVVALFQVLVYVGAVMVFMVYTIMLLDDRDAAYRTRFSAAAVPARGATRSLAQRRAAPTLPASGGRRISSPIAANRTPTEAAANVSLGV